MHKILITGKDGQVGYELERSLQSVGQVIAFNREGFDLTNPDMMVKIIRELKPTIIVNAAAYTAVDKAESEFERSNQINGIAPGILAEEAKRLNALLIHYSTDYVFDGCSKTPYTESDLVHPINVYGQTKLNGEKAIQAVGGRHYIFRTSWVYGMRGKNFLLTMLRLGKEKTSLNIVADQLGAPTWSKLIAETTKDIINLNKENYGIYNLTSSGSTTWCDFAKSIFTHYIAYIDPEFVIPTVNGIPAEQYPTPAIRPSYSVLSHDKLYNAFGVIQPDWETSLNKCLEEHKRQMAT